VGEVHGTREIPAIVGAMACAAAGRGLAVRVGLEILREEQRSIDAFVASSGSAQARALLLRGAFWQGASDGRTSEAMVDLLEVLRALGRQGADVRVIAIDEDAADRERAMATTLAAVRGANPQAWTIALTGRVHASRRDFDGQRSMAWHLARRVAVVAVAVEPAGGEAWTCFAAPPEGCGPMVVAGSGSGVSARLEQGDPPPGFDAVLYVGTVTASPPAVEPPMRSR